MPSIRSVALLFVVMTANTVAFQPCALATTRKAYSDTAMKMANGNSKQEDAPVSSRRALFQSMGLLAASAVVTAASPQPASATYSAFTRREQDWQERMENGEVKISSARDLRRQLQEIAPMNDEGSKIFCPNGPSSAVSPLMENKCGDRMAVPSVYGRTEDNVGNSIPGFAGGRYTAEMGGGSSSIAAEIGGFPTYNNKMGR